MRRIVSVVVVLMAICSCTSEPEPVGPGSPPTVCDVLTAEFVTGLVETTSVTDAGCTADVSAGISVRQAWTVNGVTMSTYVTDREVSADAPQKQQCLAGSGGRERACVVTDDAAVVETDGGWVVTTVAPGATTSTEVASAEPAAGPFLVDYTVAVASALESAPDVPTLKRPVPTTIPPVTPASAPRHAPGWEPLNTVKCVLHMSDSTVCASTDPAIEILFNSRSGDSSACTFGGLIDFGDEKSAEYRIPGGRGLLPMTTHTYTRPGTYRITATAKVLSGACTAYPGAYTFTLQAAATPATCEHRFDPDRGRTYLYSMLPIGDLVDHEGNVATRFEYSLLDGDSNVFTDEAGVRWTLMSDFGSKEHQPAGWGYVSDDAVYRKFVSEPDSRGGSFEAVLMPDGVVAGTPFAAVSNRRLTYARSNWLLFGPGMPTYNLVHPQGVAGNVNHLVEDWYPHVHQTPDELGDRKDDRYVPPIHVIDPRVIDWRRFRERVEEVEASFDAGYRYDAATKALVRGADSRPVGSDVQWVAEDRQRCVR